MKGSSLAAQPAGDSDGWQWIMHDPAPVSDGPAHTSPARAGAHQRFFSGAEDTLKVAVGDKLSAYTYLDPGNPPREVMLEWNDGSWGHRAYWGENLVSWGQDNTPSRQRIGRLPPLGQWVRLQVPAAAVGLEGREINGIAFTLFDGRATWDRAGNAPQQRTLKVAKGDTLYADVNLDPDNAPHEVMLQWNDGSWEHRAYWGERNLLPRGVEGTASRHFVEDPLPSPGQWARLKVAASSVGLEGREVVGMAFTLSNGRASWNRAGLLSPPVMPALIYPAGVI